MLGNVMDHRTDTSSPECDATFEPSAHDNAKRPDGSAYFDYETATADPSIFLCDGNERYDRSGGTIASRGGVALSRHGLSL